MKCPYCHSEIDDDSRWCDQCGKALMFCPECRTPRRGSSCPVCGAVLESADRFFAPGDGGLPARNGTRKREPQALTLEGEGMTLRVREGDFGRRGGIFPELASCPYVSGRHGSLRFFPDESRWGICDCGSTNGTFVNGSRLDKSSWHFLSPGDRLRIATLEFTVKDTTT